MNRKYNGFNADIAEIHFRSAVGINIVKQIYIFYIFLKYFC